MSNVIIENPGFGTKTSLIRKIFSRPGAFAFFGSFIAGFFTHLFVFTNLIPNSDGIRKIYDTQQMTISGRWFLHYASMFHKYIEAPALIGFLSLLFISLAAYLTAESLSVRNKYAAFGAGVLMAVFPATAYTYLYTFTASAYFFGLLLAVAGVYATVRFRFGFIPGAILLAASIGTYQIYVAAAAALAVIFLIREILRKDSKVSEVLRYAARLAGFGLLGGGLYYAILKIMLAVKGLELLSYKGMNEFTFADIPKNILGCFGDTFGYFFRISEPNQYSTPLHVGLNILLASLLIIFVIIIIFRSKAYRSPAKIVILIILAAVFPIAADFSYVLGMSGEITQTMRYPLVFALLLPLCAFEGIEGFFKKAVSAVLSVLLAAGVIGSALFCAQIDNIVYTAAATAHRATESFCTRLVLRVESLEGYTPDMPVYIIGSFPTELYHSDIEIYSLTANYSAPKDSVLELNKHIYGYLNDWLNVPWDKPSEDDMIALSDSAEFKRMPLYPADGSVAISDGRVIVKLAETYTPMRDFEISYENRR